MQVVFGTKNDILIINRENDLMTIRNFEQKWFSGQSKETTVTFPISSLVGVAYIEPTPFKRGRITFSLDITDSDPVVRRLSMSVLYKNRDTVVRLVHDLQHQINFT